MQTSTPPAPDPAASLPPYLPVSALEAAARAGVRAIPDAHARLRDTAYARFSAALAQEQASSPRRMPWDDPQQVTEVTRDGAIAALRALDQEVKAPGTVTRPEYDRYAAALQRALERSSPGSNKPRGKYERQCARPGCTVVFHTDQPSAKFHSDSCRQMAYRQVKRDKVARLSSAPAGQDQPRSGVHSATPAS